MSKIRKTVEALDLEPVIEALVERRERGASLRELRDYYNDRVIEAMLTEAGGSVLTDAETVRAAVRGKIESEGERIEIEHELSEMGVDIDALERRLVSHETVRQYLQDEDVAPETESSAVTVAEVHDTVEWAMAREEAIIKRKLDQLAQADMIAFEEVAIDTAVTVTCADTGTAYSLEEFIERGGC